LAPLEYEECSYGLDVNPLASVVGTQAPGPPLRPRPPETARSAASEHRHDSTPPCCCRTLGTAQAQLHELTPTENLSWDSLSGQAQELSHYVSRACAHHRARLRGSSRLSVALSFNVSRPAETRRLSHQRRIAFLVSARERQTAYGSGAQSLKIIAGVPASVRPEARSQPT
jgi:hypothetical protein